LVDAAGGEDKLNAQFQEVTGNHREFEGLKKNDLEDICSPIVPAFLFQSLMDLTDLNNQLPV
jgi:hypothetical protein